MLRARSLRMGERYDLICFSHLRWDFVYHRLQHLLVRAARDRRVFFVEEPVYDRAPAHLSMRRSVEGVIIVQPTLPRGTAADEVSTELRTLIDHLVDHMDLSRYVLWFSTPAALPFTHHLEPCGVVYDCLDDLARFRGTAASPPQSELRLLGAADVVFTGGHSLRQATSDHHSNVHAFPSPIEVAHFARARQPLAVPADQAAIVGPRIGFVGAIDERVDLELLDAVAALRPDHQLVMLGAIATSVSDRIPRRANLHWLGVKTYGEVPQYLAGWHCAMLPLARNDATRFLGPSAAAEYLAAGRAVVSTSVDDVVEPYRDLGLVHIADGAAAFSRAIDVALTEDATQRQHHADRWLAEQSWDQTWREMQRVVDRAIAMRAAFDDAPRSRRPSERHDSAAALC